MSAIHNLSNLIYSNTSIRTLSPIMTQTNISVFLILAFKSSTKFNKATVRKTEDTLQHLNKLDEFLLMVRIEFQFSKSECHNLFAPYCSTRASGSPSQLTSYNTIHTCMCMRVYGCSAVKQANDSLQINKQPKLNVVKRSKSKQ